MLVMRVPGSLKTALDKAAADNLRSMSSMASWILSQWLEGKSYLPKQENGDIGGRRRKKV